MQTVFPSVASHQEPVDVHEQQRQQQGVEEEVEGDVRDRLQAGDTGGVQHLQGEPVQPEPEPDGGDKERGEAGLKVRTVGQRSR